MACTKLPIISPRREILHAKNCHLALVRHVAEILHADAVSIKFSFILFLFFFFSYLFLFLVQAYFLWFIFFLIFLLLILFRLIFFFHFYLFLTLTLPCTPLRREGLASRKLGFILWIFSLFISMSFF